MKTTLILSAVFLLASSWAPAQVAQQIESAPLAAYSTTARSAHSRTWSKVEWRTNSVGRAIPHTDSYLEMATGLHRKNDQGSWVDASDQIEIQPGGGALANQSAHRVFIPGNLFDDAFQLDTTDSKTLVSRPLGLAYASDEGTVLIAGLRDGPTGQLLPSGNSVIYTNICDNPDCRLDLLVVNKLAGWESDLVIRTQLPDPRASGLTNNVRVQWWTEFLSSPEPIRKPRLLANGLSDESLDFGEFKMGAGKAYLVGANGASETVIPVLKHWITISNRKFLVEELLLSSIESQLAGLPAHEAFLRPRDAGRTLMATKQFPLPSKRLPCHSTRSLLVASADYHQELGFVLDYDLFGTIANFTFLSDTTYMVTNTVNLSGLTTFEGGTVIKFSTNSAAELNILADVLCKSGPYRPIIFTAKNDDTVGSVISGSTGNPTNYYGSGVLINQSGVNFHDFKCSYAAIGFHTALVDGDVLTLSHFQFLKCMTALDIVDRAVTVNALNGLFCSASNVFKTKGDAILNGQNLTAHLCGTFSRGKDNELYLTNSLLVAVTNLATTTYVLGTNYTLITTNELSIFQTVGCGAHYLSSDSPYRNSGTTNLDSNLLLSLRAKTTYPPLVLASMTLPGKSLTLFPQAERDTSIPDLGWHYDPLDWVLGGVSAPGSFTVTINPGTAVGICKTNGSDGLQVPTGSSIVLSQGTLANPVWIVGYNTVQEGSGTNWSRPVDAIRDAYSAYSSFYFRFTYWSSPAQDLNYGNSYFSPSYFQDCQFYGGTLTAQNNSLNFTNCLLRRVNTDLEPFFGNIPVIRNNLFYGGTFNFVPYFEGYDDVVIQDNFFDHTTIPSDLSTWTSYQLDHNGYFTNCDRLVSSCASDVILTNTDYKVGPLGDYYYPTNGGMLSRLINAGSTTADTVGLYHYTVSTNLVSSFQIKETNTVVDIGWHRIATDGSGQARDSDSDGIPDYLEDSNGNGSVDSGETDWQSATDPGLKVLITQPRTGSTIP